MHIFLHVLASFFVLLHTTISWWTLTLCIICVRDWTLWLCVCGHVVFVFFLFAVCTCHPDCCVYHVTWLAVCTPLYLILLDMCCIILVGSGCLYLVTSCLLVVVACIWSCLVWTGFVVPSLFKCRIHFVLAFSLCLMVIIIGSLNVIWVPDGVRFVIVQCVRKRVAPGRRGLRQRIDWIAKQYTGSGTCTCLRLPLS